MVLFWFVLQSPSHKRHVAPAVLSYGMWRHRKFPLYLSTEVGGWRKILSMVSKGEEGKLEPCHHATYIQIGERTNVHTYTCWIN